MEQVRRYQRGLGIKGEDVGVAALGGGHLLLLAHLFHGVEQVVERRGFFIARRGAGCFHPLAQLLRQIFVAALQKQAHGSNGFLVAIVGGESLHARPQTAVNVELEAGMRVAARQIDVAGRHQKVAMDEVHQPVREVARKVGTEVGRTVLAQAPRDVDARILFGGELDIRVSLVVAQQDVVARLPLLDEIVLEREGFFFVVDTDEFEVARLADERAGLGIYEPVFIEVAAHAGAQILGLAHIDHRAVSVLVQVHAGQGWQLGHFFAELGKRIYTLIVSRTFLAAFFLTLPLLPPRVHAQQPPPPTRPQEAPPQTTGPQVAEPPEEDQSFKPRTYDFNPLKASKSIEIGNEYFKKGSYIAAKGRYTDATLYDPGSAEAFAKLGEVEEKLHNLSAARSAYAKSLELDPKSKDAADIRKRMEKLPGPPIKSSSAK